MPSPEQSAFLERRARLAHSAFECVITSQLCFGGASKQSDHRIVKIGGGLATPNDPPEQTQFICHWIYDTPTGEVSLEVAIGCTGDALHPVIAVTTSDGFSQSFTLESKSFPVRPSIIEQVKRLTCKT